MVQDNKHHLIIGGAGAIGVSFAYHLYRVKEKISILVRESHRNQFHRNATFKECLVYYNLTVNFATNCFVWVASLLGISIVAYAFLSKLFFGIILATFLILGSPVHMFIKKYIPKVHRQLIPLESVNFSVEDVKKTNEKTEIHFIWIALSSTQLRTIDLTDISKAAPNAIIINLTPSIFDYDYLKQTYPALCDKLCQASIPFGAYQYPLKGNREPDCCYNVPEANTQDKKGVAGFLLPASVSIGGPNEVYPILQSLVDLLKKSGVPASLYKKSPNALHDVELESALYPVLVLCLELSDWKFSKIFNNDLFPNATMEVLNLLAKEANTKPNFIASNKTIMTFLCKAAAFLAERHLTQLFPVDLEVFVQYHFTKVADQMLIHIHEYYDQTTKLGVKNTNLKEIIDQIEKKRAMKKD